MKKKVVVSEGIKKLTRSFYNKIKNRTDILCGIEYEFHPTNAIFADSDSVLDTSNSHIEYVDSLQEAIKIIKSSRGVLYPSLDDNEISDGISTMNELTEWMGQQYASDITVGTTSTDRDLIKCFNIISDLFTTGLIHSTDISSTDGVSRFKEIVLKYVKEDLSNFSTIDGTVKELMYDLFMILLTDSNGELDISSDDITDAVEVVVTFIVEEGYELITTLLTSDDSEELINVYERFRYILSDISQESDIFTFSPLSWEDIDPEIIVFTSEDNLEYLDDNFIHFSDMDKLECFVDRITGNYIQAELIDFEPHNISTHDLFDDISIDTYQVQSDLDDLRIDYREVETDNNNQIEVITDTMTFSEALAHMEEMFDYISDNGLTSVHSGMHISISNTDWKNKKFNFLKFFTLMQFTDVLKVFPERLYVENIYNKFIESSKARSIIENYINISPSISSAVSGILNALKDDRVWADTDGSFMSAKKQSVKFGDYTLHNGRIELRFFGGKYYEERYDDIEKLLLQSIYIMEVSYGDMYENEYKKMFVKLLDEMVKSNSFKINNEYVEVNSFQDLFDLIKNNK